MQVVGALSGGGIQAFMLDIMRHYDRSRFQIDVCEMTTESGPLAKDAGDLGARVYTCSLRKRPLSFKKRFGAILEEGRYQCVHVLRERVSAIPVWVAKCAGVPIRIVHYQSAPQNPPLYSPRTLLY